MVSTALKETDSNLDDPVKNALTRRKTWELENEKIGKLDEKMLQYQGCDPMPIFEPQVLFEYPPRKRLAMQLANLPAFCFPEGVKACLLERTPSMSNLNTLEYGQGCGFGGGGGGGGGGEEEERLERHSEYRKERWICTW
ncbi:hypothetical protein Scep_002166 [Stephania cephalantha]|uniref:Uncharacterized protein n=1 Tax=Stephania cephalantha TaxID=152367 RepID=A0AAP0Q4E8_9MAGN